MVDFFFIFVLMMAVRDMFVTCKSFRCVMAVANDHIDKAFACHDAPR
ncbi:hypothetical protein M527_18530 [Sphingobium indicum IP26]|nr:hypothetical protein M527_18530 [Sphingobium indicum IP26]